MSRATLVQLVVILLAAATGAAHLIFSSANPLALVGIAMMCLGLALLCAARRRPHPIGRQVTIRRRP
jgi:hypothetical protein